MKRSRGAMYGTEVSSMNVLILTSDEFWFCGPFQVSCGKYPGPIWALHLEWQQDQRVILNILSRVRHFCITLISAREITWEATTESPWERIWSAHGHEHSRKSWDCSVTWQTDYSIQIRRCTSWTQPPFWRSWLAVLAWPRKASPPSVLQRQTTDFHNLCISFPPS